MTNHIRLGPVTVRLGSRGIAKWGYPWLQIGGLSIWSRTNDGDLHLAAYHPRRSITWLWFIGLSKRQPDMFGWEEFRRIAKLYAQGNPHACPPRWYHRFCRLAVWRRGQWYDYFRLPFGRTIMVGHQEPMWRKP